MNRITRITLGLGLAATAACSSSDKPTKEEYDDTAQAIASTTATSGGSSGDAASMADSISLSLGTLPTGISIMGDGQFQGSRLGVNYKYTLTCKTAGTVAPCAATTDEATVKIAWSGNLDSPALDASVTREGTWTVTGLQGGTATFSGDSSFSFDATMQSIFRPGVTASYSFDADASYDAVKISTADKLIVDGKAEFDVSAHHKVDGTKNDVDASFDIHAELAFHADHTASLTLDGDQHYTLNLNTGAVVRVSAN